MIFQVIQLEVSVGETHEEMNAVLDFTVNSLLPGE